MLSVRPPPRRAISLKGEEALQPLPVYRIRSSFPQFAWYERQNTIDGISAALIVSKNLGCNCIVEEASSKLEAYASRPNQCRIIPDVASSKYSVMAEE